MAIVTCHTEGCGNAEIPIDVDNTYTDPETGETQTITAFACGVCGQSIGDARL